MIKISEAMSEIKLFVKKISNQREIVLRHMIREDFRRDPFDRDGSTQEVQVKAALQSIKQLEENIVTYRAAITQTNMAKNLTLEGITMSVAEWLIWKREVLPIRKNLLAAMSTQVKQAMSSTPTVRTSRPGVETQDVQSKYVFNVSDKWIAEEIQKLDTIEERLDGQLSLFNATTDVIDL
jgi:hypothetical protein